MADTKTNQRFPCCRLPEQVLIHFRGLQNIYLDRQQLAVLMGFEKVFAVK